MKAALRHAAAPPMNATAPAPDIQAVRRALAVAYTHVPDHWLRQATVTRTTTRAAFIVAKEAANTVLRAAGIDPNRDHLHPEVADALNQMQRIIDGPDPRGGGFRDQARAAAGQIGYALALTFSDRYAIETVEAHA